MFRSFDIGSDKANLGVFRYNNEVDIVSQILLGDYKNDKEGLLAAFDKIPYNGSGKLNLMKLKVVSAVSLHVGTTIAFSDISRMKSDCPG